MATGSTAFLTCVARTDGGASVAPCVDTAAGATYPVVANGVLVDPDLAARLMAAAQPFDYALAAQMFGWAFTGIVFLFWLSYGLGKVLSAIEEF